MNKNSFIYGSIFMIFMNFFMRMIGFAYDVFLSNILGAEAMGLFQIASSTLMTFLIITISGIPTAMTKIIAKENSKGGSNKVEGIFRATFTFNLLLSIVLSILLLYFSEFISVRILKNKDMILGVYFMVPAIIILSISNILKAYFYGIKNMVAPSIAQIIEHVTRFIIVLSILYYMPPKNPIHGAIIAILGISIGEFFDLLWSLLSKRYLYKNKRDSTSKESSFSSLLKVLSMAVPLTMAGSFGVIFRFINTILIPSRLMAAGYSNSESIATFGRIMGMAMPLVHLSFIVTSALVINLIPNLSEQIALKKYRDIRRNIHLSIKGTLLVAFPLTVLYTIFSKPLAVFLYKDIQVAPYIAIMAFSTIAMSVQHIISGVLLGLNKQVKDTINGIVGMVIRIILIYVLVGDPRFGIDGYFIAFYASMIITIILDLFTLRTVIKLNINYLDIIGKPLLASCFMILAIYISTYGLNSFEDITPLIFSSSVLLGFLAYIFILFLTKAVPKHLFKKLFGIK